ncbi:MAG: response regulator transcription factor [Oscillospiraceae bacterium]|nr:response regulator transcription factor [Oscillospiraceae bacterium]
MSLGKVLIIDEDKNSCSILKSALEKDGNSVILAHDGENAMITFRAVKTDFILLDITISGADGWQLCRDIRKKSNIPLIIISSRSEVFDKVLGLELGADDYIVKPFDIKEVMARIKAVHRRTSFSGNIDNKEVIHDGLVINLSQYELKVNGIVKDAPPKELELLYFLASNPNRVYTRDQLLDEVWGFEYYGDSRTVDVHIKRLREKLEGASSRWALKTVWGVGYKFETEDEPNTKQII